jgi:uncharacterized membrane protein YcgQ (UPF0703/DUF1980 family)
MKHIKPLNEFLTENAKYYIEVSVRDARRAQDIYNDQFKRDREIKMTASNYYEISDEESAENLLSSFRDQDIELYTNL